MEILFESLINLFSLSVSFGIITGGKVNMHVLRFSKESEELGDKLRAAVTSDMGWNSILEENMDDEDLG